MDQAVVAAQPLPLEETQPQVPEGPKGPVAKLRELPQGTKIKLGVALAAVVALMVAMAIWANKGDWRVLYTNLPDKEAGAIIAQLQQMNVPYKYTEGGASIMVPADKLYDLKMKLAAAGYPKSSVVGNELLDTARFGQTDRQERMNMQRALEGELVRTILKMDGVEDARVHLALPQQNGFFREQQKPSASVMLTLLAGRSLDRGQTAAIVHLVASSVPDLSDKAVSVVDQHGNLMSGPGENTQQSLDEQQLRYVHQVEGSYTKRVQDLLEPVVGAGNLRATVTADLDFNQTEATSELYGPNQGASNPQSVRSQQTTETSSGGNTVPTGVPGAVTNQPPVPATAPVNGASAPLQTAYAGQTNGNAKKEAITNFEVDKTVRVTRNATGAVRRINAAVVVNYKTVTDAKGKTSTQPLTQDELDKLTALVQEAVGYNKDRGDSVRVISAPFQPSADNAGEELPLWQQQWLRDLLRNTAVPAALTLVALAIIFGVIRPTIKQALAPPPPAEPEEKSVTQLDAIVDDDNLLPGAPGAVGADGALPALEAPQENGKLEAARKLARDNPAAVANILRNWVTGEEG